MRKKGSGFRVQGSGFSFCFGLVPELEFENGEEGFGVQSFMQPGPTS
jgi:hypothetical protein